jgi:multicomponent Na+:H+ antiporter subunit D
MSELMGIPSGDAPAGVLAILIVCAAIAFLLPARLAWMVAAAGTIAASAVALWWWIVAAGRTPLHGDGVSVFAIPLVTLCAVVAQLAAGAKLRDWSPGVAPSGVALLMFVAIGWIGALRADGFLQLFIASEVAWFAATGVVALCGDRHRQALNGALRMVVMGGVGAALFVFGAALVWRGVGSLQLAALPIAQLAAPQMVGAGVALMIASLALKAAIAPLHGWIGAAMSGSGGAAALGIGAVNGVGAVAVIIRVGAGAIAAPSLGEGVSLILSGLGAAAIVLGSLQALGTRSFLRLAAYAGVAQAGGVLMSAALGSPVGFAAAFVQMAAMAAAVVCLLGAGAINDIRTLNALDGMGRRAPFASAAMTLGALSLMGAPLTLGFLGRWRLIEASAGAGWSWIAVLAIGASLAGVFYGGRIIQRLYFRRASQAHAILHDGWEIVLTPALMVAGAGVLLGFQPSALLHAADAAASLLWSAT